MRKLFMCVLLLAGTLTLQAQIKIGKMKIDTKKKLSKLAKTQQEQSPFPTKTLPT